MTVTTPDTENQLFQLAADLVNQSSRNIFLTGKAGTGKTTFLRFIRANCPKQMAVVAPTGVAAINAGGVTIHSFLQLPLSPFVPVSSVNQQGTDRHQLISRLRFNNEKRKLLQQLELLIIDEISMVRCDVLDAIDVVLRHVRRQPSAKFGGVQVLFIGDMFQLAPVVKEEDWKILAGFYDSPYFFDSLVMKDSPPLYIEFERVYRQNDEKFIRLLNQVRNNELDEEGKAILESRFDPRFHLENDAGYVLLTTHNEIARSVNRNRLERLPGATVLFNAKVEGDFPDHAFPADGELQLKQGAQVMFIRNDSAENGKRFFNGKIGTVCRLEDEKIFVKCKGEEEEIEVKPEEWDNIRYTLNPSSQTMEENVLGSFRQFPLRLAWAITIHKSQGLTFDKAIIDAGEAFAPGQVYVALSRCSNLEGMVLKSRIRLNNLFTDPKILAFSRRIADISSLQQELNEARNEYLLRLLISWFDFNAIILTVQELQKSVLENEKNFNKETSVWINAISGKLRESLETSTKFQVWLRQEFLSASDPFTSVTIIDRTRKASRHFTGAIEELLAQISLCNAVTDSREHAKEFNTTIKEIFSVLQEKKFFLGGLEQEWDIRSWHERRKGFTLPPLQVNVYSVANNHGSESPHPELLKLLKKKRDDICSRKDLPVYMIASSYSLEEMARYLPHTISELQLISGFGEVKARQYGQEFLALIQVYAAERGLTSHIREKGSKKRKGSSVERRGKANTYEQTLEFIQKGKTIQEIALERSLAISTIESHIAKLIEDKLVNIDDFVPAEKQRLILDVLLQSQQQSLTGVKEKLGDMISYSEIRMVLATLVKDPGTKSLLT